MPGSNRSRRRRRIGVALVQQEVATDRGAGDDHRARAEPDPDWHSGLRFRFERDLDRARLSVLERDLGWYARMCAAETLSV